MLFWAPEHVGWSVSCARCGASSPGTTVTSKRCWPASASARPATELWKAVHPELDDKNIFDPDLTDDTGKPVYDLIVDSRMGMPDACADYVHDWLVERGAFRTR